MDNIISDKQMELIITWAYNQYKSGITLDNVKDNWNNHKEIILNLGE